MSFIDRRLTLWYTCRYTFGGAMSSLLKLKDEDVLRIEKAKSKLNLDSKVGVLRYALELLEKEIERKEKVKKWQEVAKKASKNSMKVNKEFFEALQDE